MAYFGPDYSTQSKANAGPDAHAPYGYDASGKPVHPGWDPSSGALGYSQPVTGTPDFGRKGAPLFLTSQAPQRLDEYRRFAEPKIGEQYRGALMAQLETLIGRQQTGQRQQAGQLAMQGVDPAAYWGHFAPEQNQQNASQVAALQGEAASGQAGAEMDLRGQILNALNQIESYYDAQQMQWSLAAKNRSMQRSAAKAGTINALIGGALGVGAQFAGTEAGATALAAFL